MMKAFAVLSALVIAGVLCYAALFCCALLFGSCCGGSAWNSSTIPWMTKAGLLAGCILPPAAGLYLIFEAVRPER